MRRLLLALPFLVLAPLATARAEEPATYPLHTWREVWKAGDVKTESVEEKNRMAFDLTIQEPSTGEEVKQQQRMTEHTTYTVVTQCLAADDKGAPTKMLVYVKDWSRSKGAVEGAEAPALEPDTCLTGMHLEVVRTPEAHAYKILTPEAEPTDDAITWLEKKYGADAKDQKGADLDKLGRPSGPVKVGDSWAGDPAKLDVPFAIDAAASSVKLTLESVNDGTLVIPIEMRLKLKEFPMGQGAPAPFTEGGVMTIDGKLTHSLAPSTFESEGSLVSTLKGTAAIQGMATVVLDISSRIQGASSTGGEMPAVPGATK